MLVLCLPLSLVAYFALYYIYMLALAQIGPIDDRLGSVLGVAWWGLIAAVQAVIGLRLYYTRRRTRANPQRLYCARTARLLICRSLHGRRVPDQPDGCVHGT